MERNTKQGEVMEVNQKAERFIALFTERLQQIKRQRELEERIREEMAKAEREAAKGKQTF